MKRERKPRFPTSNIAVALDRFNEAFFHDCGCDSINELK